MDALVSIDDADEAVEKRLLLRLTRVRARRDNEVVRARCFCFLTGTKTGSSWASPCSVGTLSAGI